MITPMTFDTNGDDQNLTWARDDASVMDTIMGARTGSNLEDSSLANHPEILGRGSSPMCVIDLDGYVLNNGKAVINRARGYIAGRYYEITNEIVGNLNPKAGVGLITLNASSYPDGDPITIPGRPYVGQTGYGKSINDIKRQPSERENTSIYATILVYYTPVTGASSPLYTTPRDTTQTMVDYTDTHNPYAFTPKPQSWRWSSVVVSPSGGQVANNGDNLPGQVATYLAGDKDTGWWGVVRSDLSRFGFQTADIGYTKYTKQRDMTNSVPAILAYGDLARVTNDPLYNNYNTNINKVVASRAFGIIADQSGSDYNPTLSDWYNTASILYANRTSRSLNHNKYNQYQHPITLSGASITVTNTKAGSGLRGFDGKARWLSSSSASAWPTTVANSTMFNMSAILGDLRLSDVFVDIQSVEYITGTELDRIPATYNYVPTYRSQPSGFTDVFTEDVYAKVTLSARTPYKTYEVSVGNIRAYGADYPMGGAIYAHDVTYIIPLWAFTHMRKETNNNKDSYVTDISIATADDFERACRSIGSTDKQILAKMLAPLVGTQMLYNHYLANRDAFVQHFLDEYNTALHKGAMYTSEVCHIMPGLVQTTKPSS